MRAATAYVLGGLQQVALNANVGQDAWGDMLRAWLQSVEVDVQDSRPLDGRARHCPRRGRRRQSHYYRGEKVDWRASLELRVPQVFFAAGYGSVIPRCGDLHAVFSTLRRRGPRSF